MVTCGVVLRYYIGLCRSLRAGTIHGRNVRSTLKIGRVITCSWSPQRLPCGKLSKFGTIPVCLQLRTRVELQSGFTAALLRCPWCLSVWVGLSYASLLSIDGNVSRVSGIICLGLAASRLANLGNDVFHCHNRTPRFKLESDDPNAYAVEEEVC